jgi:hypothetical protein
VGRRGRDRFDEPGGGRGEVRRRGAAGPGRDRDPFFEEPGERQGASRERSERLEEYRERVDDRLDRFEERLERLEDRVERLSRGG